VVRIHVLRVALWRSGRDRLERSSARNTKPLLSRRACSYARMHARARKRGGCEPSRESKKRHAIWHLCDYRQSYCRMSRRASRILEMNRISVRYRSYLAPAPNSDLWNEPPRIDANRCARELIIIEIAWKSRAATRRDVSRTPGKPSRSSGFYFLFPFPFFFFCGVQSPAKNGNES